MSKFMLMEPSNQSFQELMGNGVKYAVPRFQRDYAWEREQWEELWADIETLPEEEHHYMGYIVLQRTDKHLYEIIDGQQRLITLSLVILAAMKQIAQLVEQGQEVNDNEERLRVLTERFIGSKNPISLRVDNKISLNRNNGTYFKSLCSQLSAPKQRRMTYSNRLLAKAFDYFFSQDLGASGAQIAVFIEQLTYGMIFTKIVVQDQLNAYKVFETLNARGVQLSTPDLLKNHLFSVVTQHDDVTDEELNDLDEQWSEILFQLGERNFTDFIRYHHNFQAKLVTKKSLFRAVRKRAMVPQAAHKYLASLSLYAPIYAALLHPEDEWWSQQDEDYGPIKRYLEGFQLFHIKQPFTVLMAAFQYFNAKEFNKLTQYMYVLSIRYNVVCHFSPSEQEVLYNQMAMKIFNKEYQRASHVKNGLEFQKLYPQDDTFSKIFQTFKMPTRKSPKKPRFLLADIEAFLGQPCNHRNTTLEHICPYHPDEHWHQYFGEGVNDIQDRLGNVILLGQDHLKRADFEMKKQVYKSSSFCLAKKIATYPEWDYPTLNVYQTWLSEQAALTWRVD